MKLKKLRICLVFAALVLLLCVSAFAFTGNGGGTASDPYKITSAAELMEISNDPDAYYKITKAITINDPTNFEYDENGVIIGVKEGAEVHEWIPIENFTGSLDCEGASYYISGLYVKGNVNGGLFANTDGATINGVKIYFSLVESEEYAGLFVGKAENGTTITNCLAHGSVIGKTTQVQNTAGGIAGYVDKTSAVTSSVSYATVSGANSYSSNIGGLVGYNAGTISNSASDAKVAGSAMYYDAAVGGIAGSNAGTIQNCTSQATVKGETTSSVNDVYVGGIAGINNGTITQVKNTGAVDAKVIVSGDSIGAAGGIVGMYVDAVLENASNEGAITGSYTYNGGIVGIAISTDGKHTIKNAKNTGSVTDTYGDNGGIAGRAVAGGEGYVSTIMNFENCQTSSGSLYGEKGEVESAQVTGALGAAILTDPTTKQTTKIISDDIHYGTGISAITATATPLTNKRTVVATSIADIKLIHIPAKVNNENAFPPAPILVTFIEVAAVDEMEIISVDKSGLALNGDALNGTVVVKVYNPNLVNATTILGTSVDTQFVSAKFGNLDTVNKLTTLEISFNNVSALSATGNVAVNAMVVDTTDNMAPLCANKVA